MNEAAPFVAEFITRQRLTKLGYTESFDELDCIKADAFILIDAEIESIKAEETKKAIKKVPKKPRM